VPHLRVVLVDDHRGFVASARAMLERGPFEVVAEAYSGEEALTVVREFRPDLVLLDLRLPDISGVQVALRLSHASTTDRIPAIVLISSDSDAECDSDVVAAPVKGFLPKRDLTCDAITALLG